MLKLNAVFIVTIVIAIISNISVDLFLPSLPFIAAEFHSSIIQLAVSIYLFGAGLGQILYGFLSDTYGRKKILICGISISILGSISCIYSSSVILLLVGRFIQGIGLAACLLIVRSMLGDCYDKKNISKMYSYVSMFMEGSTLAAPIIGGYIQYYYHWRINFIFYACLSVLSLLVVILYLPETNQRRSFFTVRNLINDHLKILRNRNFLIYTFCSTFAVSSIYINMSLSSFLYESILGLNPVNYSYTLFFATSMLVIGGFLNSQLVMTFQINTLIFFGGILMFISGGIILILSLLGYIHTLSLLLPSLICMLGASFIYPNALAGALYDFKDRVGTAASLYGTCQLVGAFIFTTLMSLNMSALSISIALAFMMLGLMILTAISLYDTSLVNYEQSTTS